MPAYERAALLRRAAGLIERDVKGLADLLTRETGKAIKDSEGEIRRSLETVLLAAEEAIRIEGRHIPLDGSAMGAGKLAVMMRFPVGVVAAITPFNAPFNLAAHKIAPSIAAPVPEPLLDPAGGPGFVCRAPDRDEVVAWFEQRALPVLEECATANPPPALRKGSLRLSFDEVGLVKRATLAGVDPAFEACALPGLEELAHPDLFELTFTWPFVLTP